MQAFLPFPSFLASARVLDKPRLVKQRVECFQILRAITDPTYGWQNHPAVNQWRGHVSALALYGESIDSECKGREVADRTDLGERIRAFSFGYDALTWPTWLGDARFHRSHQSNLVRKYPEWYRPHFPDIPDDIPYFWPSKEAEYTCDITVS